MSGDAERERVERVFAEYGEDSRKRRAWDAGNPGNVAIRAELAAAVRALAADAAAGERGLLDVGCGTGWWLAELAADGVPAARLHGLELLPARAAAARERVPGARVETGDARALPYADDEMSLVTVFTVLSSMRTEADVEAALREARRVLAPGGVLAVWEPRVPNPANRATRLIRMRTLRRVLGEPDAARTLTVLPALARRCSPRAYAALARVPALRTHRLAAWTVRRERSRSS